MLAVIMPVLNCLKYTVQAIETAEPRSALYLIDNGSTDGTREWAQREADAGRIRYLPQSHNIGVAKSWNLGIRKAFEDGHDSVLVSNNDVVYDVDTITNLECWYEETGGFITVHSVAYLETLKRQERKHTLVQPPDFAGFVISKKIVDVVGWFDEKYKTAYWEDLDYVIRLKDAGITYGSALDSIVCHFHSRTIHEGGVNPWPQQELNRRRFIKKWGRHRLQEVGQ
jgi:GT2 family glycosyltransferase